MRSDPGDAQTSAQPAARRWLAWRPSARQRNLVRFGVGVSGFVVMGAIAWWEFTVGPFDIPGGDTTIWDRAGDQVRAGLSPYQLATENPVDAFWYALPFAVAFALVSWLPTTVVWLAIVAMEFAAVRYLAGSWIVVGIIGWFPLTTFELVSGNFNMIVVAGIVLAIRGRPELATVMSFAKISPILAVHPRQSRRVAIVAAAMVAITLPVAWLWIEWVRVVIGSIGTPIGLAVPVPLVVRWAIAAGLLLWWRPWSRALAAAVAIPAFYYVTFLLTLVILADRRRPMWFRRAQLREVALERRASG